MDEPDQYMWINKSASSSHLSRGDDAESAAINSFVQSKLNQACSGKSSKPYRPRAATGDLANREVLNPQNDATPGLTRSGPGNVEVVPEFIDIDVPELEELENQSMRNDINVRDVLGFFRTFVPPEAQSLGLSLGRFRGYAATLLHWSLHHDDIFLGLTLSYHCHTLRDGSSSAFTKGGIEALRSRFLQKVDARLEGGIVDDVLIQVIALAIAIDRCLGHKEFIAAHVKALEAGVTLRGGLTGVGSSRPDLDDSLSLCVIAALFDAAIVCGSTDLRLVRQVSPHVYSELPEGMQALARGGYFSPNMIKTLLSFEDWSTNSNMRPHSTMPIWSHAVSASLSVFEWCVLLALVCIADDLISEGDCMRMLLWQDSNRLAEDLLNRSQLWTDIQLGDVLIWLISVIATPKKKELVPFKAQSELQQRLIRLRPELRDDAIIEKKLRRYFCPQTSLELWKYAWKTEF